MKDNDPQPDIYKPDLLILFSGGADSVLMLEIAKSLNKTPFCLLIDYEQKHDLELTVAKDYLKKNDVRFELVHIKGLNVGSGLTKNGYPGMYENVHPMHVPSRNLMFVSIAASYAEAGKIPEIWYGADESDFYSEFPDCKQEWIGRVNKVLEINGSRKVKLSAPLSGFSKELVLEILFTIYKISPDDLFSGYGDLK